MTPLWIEEAAKAIGLEESVAGGGADTRDGMRLLVSMARYDEFRAVAAARVAANGEGSPADAGGETPQRYILCGVRVVLYVGRLPKRGWSLVRVRD